VLVRDTYHVKATSLLRGGTVSAGESHTEREQRVEWTIPSRRGFLSTFFLVPTKDGGQRPVINLNSLNAFVHTEHFKMEGIHVLRDLLRAME
jgi:hypothetical protein